jgi:hypothetical protein
MLTSAFVPGVYASVLANRCRPGYRTREAQKASTACMAKGNYLLAGITRNVSGSQNRHLRAGLRFSHKTRDPNGIRTRVTAVKGRCPRPLDDRVRRAPNIRSAPASGKEFQTRATARVRRSATVRAVAPRCASRTPRARRTSSARAAGSRRSAAAAFVRAAGSTD